MTASDHVTFFLSFFTPGRHPNAACAQFSFSAQILENIDSHMFYSRKRSKR